LVYGSNSNRVLRALVYIPSNLDLPYTVVLIHWQ